MWRVADGDELCAVHEGMLEAAGAVVALAGVEHDGVLALFGRGDEDIYLTDVNAGVAADAFGFIVENRVRAARHGFCRENFVLKLAHFRYAPFCSFLM